jgi:FtsP/CotA-like multicopper oxidase with cupredoxin domain
MTIDTLPVIPVIKSCNGLLKTTLVATQKPTYVDNKMINGLWTYNGLFSGPCLLVKPGDRVDITIQNNITLPINIHYHGMWMSPSGKADNVFIEAQPGKSLRSQFTVEKKHTSGLNWFHPHVHGYSNEMLWRGLSGIFIVDGGVSKIPKYRNCRNRVLVFKGIELDPSAIIPTMISANSVTSKNVKFTVNGVFNPTITMRPRETQVWSIANTANNGFLKIAMDNHSMTVLAQDGNPSFTTRKVKEYLLSPGSRVEIAITASKKSGKYVFRTLGFNNYNNGIDKFQWTPQTLATIYVKGTPSIPVSAPKNIMPIVSWLSKKPVKRRVITFSSSFNTETGPLFYINKKAYDHVNMHTSFNVNVNTVEEWIVRSDPSLKQGGRIEGHPFHIHVANFAVVGRGSWNVETGEATSYESLKPYGLQDTILVPAFEYVVLRMKFEKFTGKTVFHCHILFHQDKGMMGVFNIVNKNDTNAQLSNETHIHK